MPSWLAGLLGSLILGLPAIVAAVLTYRAAARAQRRTAETEDRRVDAEAFASAKGFYMDGIDELKRQLGEVRDELADERKETQRLRGETRRLRERVAKLERALRAADLPIPNGTE